jgi:DNA topoisomerase-1
MPKNLLIVESPSKAKTIEKYLGEDFKVKSSYGHIRDLSKGKKGVNIEDNFNPVYEVPPEKEKVVKELKAAAKSATEIWLATDEDREGEAISWHLCEVLGLDEDTTKRIVFREITKPAIQEAIKNPRLVDKNLVNAQQARRILDRLVGFELSEILWRKVKNKLSAGRVQSVAVKLVVEREREVRKFKPTPYYKVTANFIVEGENGRKVTLKSELDKRLANQEDAETFLNDCIGAEYKIDDIQVKPTQRKPSAPFTTSTLQQEASRKLSFGVRRTMSVAQKLYENGHISYMRTDSKSLSQTATNAIAEQIVTDFGEQYLETRAYKSKDANAQEAHEAIRPTNFKVKTVTGTSDMQRLYDLIWKRAIASQMANAKLEKTTVKIGISSRPEDQFKATGEVLKFDGFLKLYMESTDDNNEEEDSSKTILPPVKTGQVMELDVINGVERFTRASSRFTEASLVKKLEELGIGRPSTYAPTVSKIMEVGRGYVVKESREGVERKYNFFTLKDDVVTKKEETEITGSTSNRLYPTDIGMVVTDFLDQYFDDIMDYNFTAEMEAEFDQIAMGSAKWKDMLNGFYHPFHESVEETLEKAERAKGRRDLGVCPETGHTVLVQMTRYGPVAQIGSREEVKEDEKPRFASLKPGQSMEDLTYEEAMDLFQLPKTLGQHEDVDVIVARGRFGPYIKYFHDNKDMFVSLPRGEDPLGVSLERGIELIEEKKKADAPVHEYENLPVTKGKGRFGPFLKWNDFFINVPKRYDFENLTIAEMNELIEAKKVKEANRYIQNWPEDKVSIQNARWGPIIKFKKKNVKLPKRDGEKIPAEELKDWSLDQVKEIILAEIPNAFGKPKKAKAKPKAKAKTKPKAKAAVKKK